MLIITATPYHESISIGIHQLGLSPKLSFRPGFFNNNLFINNYFRSGAISLAIRKNGR
jgi:hypothetical protein